MTSELSKPGDVDVLKRYVRDAGGVLAALPLNAIVEVVQVMQNARDQDRFIYVMGNGGSAMTASHFVSDLNKGARCGSESRFRAISLSDNQASLLAYANDESYESVFVEPLKNFLRQGDVVMGISGSGKSRNVVHALDYAARNGAITVALVGYDGGILKGLARHVVHVTVDDMQIVEDLHLMVCHMVMRGLMCGR